MKIFVAGATGAIGRPLIAQLLAQGHEVVAVTRSPERARPLAEQGIETVIRCSGCGGQWPTGYCRPDSGLRSKCDDL